MKQDVNDMGAAKAKEAFDNAETYKQTKTFFISSAAFVANFAPPDYLVDDVLLRRYLYSLTAPTGHGKTTILVRLAVSVALGLPLGKHEVEKGKVLFFAGENPDDVRMRYIKLCEVLKIDPDRLPIIWKEGVASLSDDKVRAQIDAETNAQGPFDLVAIDSSAAYNEGDDENDNIQLLAHARLFRSFTEISGGPTVIVACHPVKKWAADNLIPRGGGSFLAEVDGNLTCFIGENNALVTDLHHQGKFRGPDFAPISFKLIGATSERLKSAKGKFIPTVYAEPITSQQRTQIEDNARHNQSDVLWVMKREPNGSLTSWAEALDWYYKNGDPDTTSVRRTIIALADSKLVKKDRGKWELTKKGKLDASEFRSDQLPIA
jgi:hypothetical protein